MTVADWAIVGLAALTALAGLRRGLVASAFALAGLLAGAILGARFAPRILSEGDTSPYTPLVGLAGAVLLASFLHGVGGFVGSFFRGSLRWGPLRAVDSAGGLLIGALTGFGIAWVVGAAALHVPGQTRLREEAQRSRVLRELNELAPPQTVLDVLARIDPFPAIAGPPPPAEPPDSGILHSPAVVAAASSVVRVLGTACGVGVAGTGWVYRPGVVVTAAHVVSGEKDTVVVPYGSSTKIRALPVAVDARNDVAVLRVAGLRAPALHRVGAGARADPTPAPIAAQRPIA